MESIEQVIGADRRLELKFDSRNRQLSAEDWTASLWSYEFNDDGELVDDSELLASARLVRVSMLDGNWLDSLDAESGDLQEVGAAFIEWDRVADIDEASAFADSLVVIDFISVPTKHRGCDEIAFGMAWEKNGITAATAVATVAAVAEAANLVGLTVAEFVPREAMVLRSVLRSLPLLNDRAPGGRHARRRGFSAPRPRRGRHAVARPPRLQQDRCQG